MFQVFCLLAVEFVSVFGCSNKHGLIVLELLGSFIGWYDISRAVMDYMSLDFSEKTGALP